MDCSKLTYHQMADIVRDIHAEIKKRNSIGVNLYAAVVDCSIAALERN